MSYFRNPLQNAVANSNITFVKLLRNSGIDIDMKNSNGWTPIHFASRYANIDMVSFFLHHRIGDPTSKINSGVTVFHMAAQNPDFQVPVLMLDTFKTKTTHLGDKDGWKMIHFAIAYGPIETIHFLLESRDKYGIDITERDNVGRTILHLACMHRDIKIIDLVSGLLHEINSDINFGTEDRSNYTPMHYAYENEDSNIAIHLIKRFPHIIHDFTAHTGLNVVHYASMYGNIKLLQYLFEAQNFDIDFNLKDQYGDTGGSLNSRLM